MEWLNTYKIYHENFKACANENYKKVMECFAGSQSSNGPKDKAK